MKILTHGSLFSGIGGFDLAAKWSGIETVWNCEILPQSRKILKKISPYATQYEDIKTCTPRYADIISGGFPCQDISINGRMQGINPGTRSGLWFEFYRIISNVRPRYVVVENVPNLLNIGMARVLADLSACGYNAEWQVLSCKQFGLPHERERLFLVAYTNKERRQERWICGHKQIKKIFGDPPKEYSGYNYAKRFYALPDAEFTRTDVRVPNFTYRIGALGNTVSPIVAKYVFDCIIKFEKDI